MSKTKAKLPFKSTASLVAILSCVLALVLLCLPFVSAKGDYKERLEEYEDEYLDEENDITCGDMQNVSLFEFARFSFVDESYKDPELDACYYFWFTVVLAVLSVITLLCAFGRRPIGIFIFGLLSFGTYIFEGQGYAASLNFDNYGWSIAYYLLYVAYVGILIGSVWMMFSKRKLKRSSTTAQSAEV